MVNLIVNAAARRFRREQLQGQYRPAQVELLFVGEAPPASGRFFYAGDSGLYRAIREAFCRIDPSIGDANFLLKFQAAGCYLIDLCPDPVDQLEPASRQANRSSHEALLSRTIKAIWPQRIVTMVRAIRGNVDRAVSRAGWNGRLIDLPYPGRWIRNRDIFIAELLPELETLTWRASGNG